MKTRLLLLLLAVPIVWLSSCKEKTSEIDYNPNVLSAKDYVRAEDAMMELFTAFFKGIHDTLVANHGYGLIDNCSVTRWPGDTIMTFGYGEVNRLCMDGKRRRGLFVAAFDEPVFEDGVTANIFTDSLFVDDSLVEATMEIKNLGLNISDIPEFSMMVTSSAISAQDTNKLNKIRIIADFTLVWSAGYSTPEIHEDDTLTLTGAASGTSADLYSFSIIIQEPLKNYIDCYWIRDGKSQITVPAGEYPTGDIDYIYDDGCYNEIHFYFNGNLFYDFLK
jgi:hypothetical protein